VATGGEDRPQIIVGCLPLGNLASFLAAKHARTKVARIIANGAIDDPRPMDRLWRASFKAGAVLSSLTDLVIVNSTNGYDYCLLQTYFILINALWLNLVERSRGRIR
jgi:hypothetical protein